MCGQTDSLALTSRKTGGLTIKSQIIKTYFKQEVEACANLFQNLNCYLLLLMVEMFFYMVQPLAQFADVHRSQFGNVLIPDSIRQCLTVKALTMALRTLALSQELISPLLTRRRIVIVHHIAQILDDTIERDEVIAGSMNEFLIDTYIFK